MYNSGVCFCGKVERKFWLVTHQSAAIAPLKPGRAASRRITSHDAAVTALPTPRTHRTSSRRYDMAPSHAMLIAGLAAASLSVDAYVSPRSTWTHRRPAVSSRATSRPARQLWR